MVAPRRPANRSPAPRGYEITVVRSPLTCLAGPSERFRRPLVHGRPARNGAGARWKLPVFCAAGGRSRRRAKTTSTRRRPAGGGRGRRWLGSPIAAPQHIVRRDRSRAHPRMVPCWPTRSSGNSGSTPPLSPRPRESRCTCRCSGGSSACARPGGGGIRSVKSALNGD